MGGVFGVSIFSSLVVVVEKCMRVEEHFVNYEDNRVACKDQDFR